MAAEPVPIGKLIEGEAGRDAVHVAICPVTAAENLHPGEHCGFIQEGDTENVGACRQGATKYAIGIVDPFLKVPVLKGQRFYLFLYPNTITALRHVWTHPAFPGATEPNKSASLQWIENFGDQYGITASRLIGAADAWIKNGDNLIGGAELEGESVPDEFWTHYETVTGRKGSGSFFTCSC